MIERITPGSSIGLRGVIVAEAEAYPMTDDPYIRQVKAEIQKCRELLAPLEAGQMHIGSREGNGPWRETTHERIAHLERTISTYEAILAALAKR
jgi:hypothetical protein